MIIRRKPIARGRARHQKGTLTLTPKGDWKVSYYVYLSEPVTKHKKRCHQTRVIGHKSSLRKLDAEQILRQELALAGAKPTSRPADDTATFGEWMRNVYVPVRAANWRSATRRSIQDYLESHIYPVFGQVQLTDISARSFSRLRTGRNSWDQSP